ncbi:MAG: hypothetical protein ACO3NL_12260 [Phycisphaerales bacterium]
MDRLRRITLAIAVALSAGAAACSSQPFRPDASTVPPALSINATVLRGEAAATVTRVEERNGRWMLLPDGSLRSESAGSAERTDHGKRPGVVRALRESEIEEIWSLAARLGLADPVAGDPVGNPRMLTPGPAELIQVVEFHAAGESWAFIARGPAESGGDRILGDFIRALADRAWMADEPPELLPTAAIRYDFGPDPYERYRGDASTPTRP